MALHEDKNSMIKEAIQEYIEVAKYCIDFDKSKDPRWNESAGCYGYPAALILLSITDAIGTIVMKGGDDVGEHFKVLNNQDYYNLNLSGNELKIIEKGYRNKLSHNAHIKEDIVLDIGNGVNSVFEKINGIYKLNLLPFYHKTKLAVDKFISSY
ncbi:MAG: hypothetical protein NUV64_01925 [Parcubacteria group bacterium]|nr:hypothetical protein [Parcubacteria group bacterium]MCR4342772.1 hypothetical protein [Patescibacteria group bacterium]